MTTQIILKSRKYPGLVALVDDEFADACGGYSWNPHPRQQLSEAFYAASGRTLYLHRFIASLIWGLDGIQHVKIDHANGDGLDCRKINLRLASDRQNSANRISGPTAYFRGVARWRDGYRAFVGKRDATKRCLPSPEEAAIERDKRALEVFGEFAVLNFPERRADYILCGPTPGLWRLA